jgi:hypothetical protein
LDKRAEKNPEIKHVLNRLRELGYGLENRVKKLIGLKSL